MKEINYTKALVMPLDFWDNTKDHDIDLLLDFSRRFGLRLTFISKDKYKLDSLKNKNNSKGRKYSDIRYYSRNYLKEYLQNKYPKENFIFLSSKDIDFFTAINKKSLFLFAEWFKDKEDKAKKYGIPINNVNQLIKFLEVVFNQKSWFLSHTLDDGTKIISLSDARGDFCSQSTEEKEVIELFRKVLKEGERNYYDIYLYHFLSAIHNTSIFDDINVWGIFPSSSLELNPEMFEFKETVRESMKCQNPRSESYKKCPNILVRHTATQRSHDMSSFERIRIGSTRHFDTICINEAYKGKKLENKNVCIFDDYLTHGNSFECARNLLRKAGVNQIIFVTLGTFKQDYQYQEYDLDGNIYSPNYSYKLIKRKIVSRNNFIINTHAKDEVENLHNIFNL